MCKTNLTLIIAILINNENRSILIIVSIYYFIRTHLYALLYLQTYKAKHFQFYISIQSLYYQHYPLCCIYIYIYVYVVN
jgi:hypothetical protein